MGLRMKEFLGNQSCSELSLPLGSVTFTASGKEGARKASTQLMANPPEGLLKAASCKMWAKPTQAATIQHFPEIFLF